MLSLRQRARAVMTGMGS